MQVKEYLQALSDEGKIRVEKIGCGNWYWSFLSEEKKTRDNVLEQLREEKDKIDAAMQELREKVTEANGLREEGEEGRAELVTVQADLVQEVILLKEELDQYRDGDPGELDRKREEIRAFRAKAEQWTDNLGILEGWLAKALGGDRERMEGIRRTYYGDEYVEGEGLKEL